VSKKPIAVISLKIRNNSVQIKRLVSLQAISLLMFSMVAVAIPRSARAETTTDPVPPAEITTPPAGSDTNTPSDTPASNTPTDNSTDTNTPKETTPAPVQDKPVTAKVTGISGGANIAGVQGAQIAVAPSTPIQVASDTEPVIVQVSVPSGSLSMTTTTGLTFTGPSTGSFIKFSGTVADVNAALATLRYQAVSTGTFTISAQVVPADSSYNPANGNYYKAIGDYISFDDAIAASASSTYEGVNGHLVTITSKQENDFVHNQVNATSWIAANDSATESDWRWAVGPESGTLFWTGGAKGNGGHSVNGLYSNWADGEPNNSEGIEDCAQMYSWNSEWNDVDCTGTLPYIVEYEGATTPPSVSLQATITPPPPVTIGSCDELEDIALNPENYWFSNITLTADIDCTDYSPMTALFTDSAQPYHGTFDGAGHNIINANIVGGSNVGLFGYVDSGTIKNINLSSSTIIGSQCVGTIVGRAYNANIENNTSSANIFVDNNWNWGYGGIVGCYQSNTDGFSYALRSNAYTGTISPNEGISYYEETGGIVGYLYTYGTSTVNADDNTYSGTINQSIYYTGGIIGYADIEGSTVVTASGNVNSGTIIDSNQEVGGILGYSESYDTSRFVLDNNTFDAEAGILNNDEYVGGVAGYLDVYDSSHVQANNNQISGLVGGATDGGKYTQDSIGGLVGYVYCDSYYSAEGNCVFNNNTNNSDIYANYDNTGGIIGYLDNYGNTIMSNNTNNGHVYSDYGYSGGMIGYFYSYNYDSDVDTVTTIQSNTNNGEIDGSENSGGIIGYAYPENDYDNSDVTLNVLNNNSNGSVYADYEAGGLIGYLEQYSYYDGSKIYFNANNNVVNGSVSGNEYYGGAIGYIYAEDYAETNMINNNLEANTINGDITTDNGGDAGGIIGYVDQYYTNMNINNNQVNANMSSVDQYSSYDFGGLIGYFYTTDSSVTQINSNTVSGSINGGIDLGGMIGYYSGNWNANTLMQNNTSTSSVNGTGYISGFIGGASISQSSLTLHQNLNEGSIIGIGENVGGFIGRVNTSANYDTTTTTLTQNINRGDVNGDSYVGGLVGYSYTNTGNPTTGTFNLQDNYNEGSITSQGNDAGGLIGFTQLENFAPEGYYTTANIQRNYNSGTVTANNYIAGGLIGETYPNDNSQSVINLDNSFATEGAVTASLGQSGGAIGNMNGDSEFKVPVGNGVYYDQTATGQTECNYNNADPVLILTDCNAVNTDGSQPDYFKNNTTNPPLNTWNFVNTWGTQSSINGGLPCLQWENPLCNPDGDNDGDGISNSVENAAPNSGDANNDGIADYRQQSVTSLVDAVSGKYNLVQTTCTQNSSVYNEAEPTANRDKEYDYLVGLTGFTTTCPTVGATAKISYYVYGSFDPSSITVRKYNPNTGAYATVSGAQVGNTTIGGQQVLLVQYFVTDGGEFDLDGVANGVIVDPVGIGTTATIAPNTGYGRI
jgi:hypothetical protein